MDQPINLSKEGRQQDLKRRRGWKDYTWNDISRMTEFDPLFRMAFPEEFVRETVIPATNKKLSKKMTRLVQEIPDHVTYRYINNEWKSFKYVEPMSRHNNAKHWIDDVNNRRHDPIGLEDVWGTKWWPTRQFTFICSLAEVNAVNSRARARKATADPQLEFRRKLAMDMMENTIGNTGVCPNSPIRPKRKRNEEHVHDKRPTYTGAWDSKNKTWGKVKTEYMRLNCETCKNGTRDL